jgi:rhodanese-related sulfurtransferase
LSAVGDIRTIDREELKAKLDRGDVFDLIMIHTRQAFETAHIPGSTHFDPYERKMSDLPADKAAEVVVYCTGVECGASRRIYHLMVAEGYTNVRRYAGGLTDWDESGYELVSGA